MINAISDDSLMLPIQHLTFDGQITLENGIEFVDNNANFCIRLGKFYMYRFSANVTSAFGSNTKVATFSVVPRDYTRVLVQHQYNTLTGCPFIHANSGNLDTGSGGSWPVGQVNVFAFFRTN